MNDSPEEQMRRAGGTTECYRADDDTPALFDPWHQETSARWPERILPAGVEDTLATIALRDGLDYGSVCIAYVTAGSGAAPKDAKFRPYSTATWWVPPIIWVMPIAESARRKTAIMRTAFQALHEIHGIAWSDYMRDIRRWNALTDAEKKKERKPSQPHSYVVNDATPEALQVILSRTNRGTCLVTDELAGLFEFGRYSGTSGKAKGANERKFYLETYEAGPSTVNRLSRDSIHIEVNGLTIFGCIQPTRLAEFSGLESDGLLQRICPYIPHQDSAIAQPRAKVDRQRETDLHGKILALTQLCTGAEYITTDDGITLIGETERDGADFASIPDLGLGWQGYCGKLHGTHARLALILHMLDDPAQTTIPTATVDRAGRLTRHLLRHAKCFYSAIPNSNMDKLRQIGGWLLTKASDHIVASDLTTGIKACRGLGTRELATLMDPFITGGWLEPESAYPSNRAWDLNPDVRTVFAERAVAERSRRAAIRARIGRIDAGDHDTTVASTSWTFAS